MVLQFIAPLIGPILQALAGAAVVAAIVLLILKWGTIVAWFRQRQALKESDKDNLAFSLQERLKNGRFKTIQGIFNQKTLKIEDHQAYESGKLDATLAKAHAQEELVLYE
jgi:hypothetical protein